jgi:hypothetical protein
MERFHKTLHDGLSHYIDSAGTNWDNVIPFFLMAYRATPNCTTAYSQFYLLHGREMNLPTEDDLRVKLSPEVQNSDYAHRMENLKSSLRKAYEVVWESNKKSHHTNKLRYDKKTKERLFEVGDIVYLFCPARKPGKCQKFRKPWLGPFKTIGKLSNLNYRIVDMKGKESVVHVNRLKRAFNDSAWKPKTNTQDRRIRPVGREELEEQETIIQSRPLVDAAAQEPQVDNERQELPVGTGQRQPTPPRQERQGTPTPERTRSFDNLDSTRRDSNYVSPDSPRTRRELRATPYGPPMTRSRTRLQSHRDSEED